MTKKKVATNKPIKNDVTDLRTEFARLSPLIACIPAPDHARKQINAHVQRVVESLAVLEVLISTYQPVGRSGSQEG